MAWARVNPWASPRGLAAVAMCCVGTAGVMAGCGGGTGAAPARVNPLAQPGQTPAAEAAAPQAPAQATPAPVTPAMPAPQSFPTAPLAKIEQRALARLHELQQAERQQRKLTATEHAHAQIGAVRDLTDAVVVRVKLRVDGTALSLGRYLQKNCRNSPAGSTGVGA